jgi:diguanylate cyclase (GGDEF)-like protein/PAS domain S-box-containing protein
MSRQKVLKFPQMASRATASVEERLRHDNAVLRLRQAQLEETLRAICGDEVDALFIPGAGDPRLFTLDGADRAYRVLIEEMGEGAVTLTPDGIIAYANRRFAELVGRPLHQVIGLPMSAWFAAEAHAALAALLAPAAARASARRSNELELVTAEGLRVPTMLSVNRLVIDGLPDALCAIVTDLTWQKRSEAANDARQTLLDVIERQRLTEESLRESLAALSLRDNALGAISQGVIIADAQGRITYINQACTEISGYSATEMADRSARLLQGPGTSPETLQILRDAIAAARPFHGELLNYRKDGSPFWNELSVTPVFDHEGKAGQFVGVMRDVTARREADTQLLLAGKVFEQSSEGFIIMNAAHNVVKVNPAFTTISGYSEAEALGRQPCIFNSYRHDHAFYEAMWAELEIHDHWQGEVWSNRKDGAEYPQWISMTRVASASGATAHFIGVFRDITERKEAEDSIRRLAHYDPLTGLPNRALMSDRVTQALQMAQRSNEPLALMYIDLDHFKNVNDTLGHRCGDLLLVALGGRMLGALRDQDTLSRMGGDEFVLLLPGADALGAAHVAQKLLQMAQLPYMIDRQELTITPSIGIALYPLDGTDYESLAKCADAAMYRAKQAGRNTFSFYTAEIQAKSARGLLLENALRRALERDQLRLHYQPQRALHGAQLVGAEALLRWEHPELGWVSPAEFIPIAEGSGLITAIGEWVLRTAVQQLKQWLDSGSAPTTMAVNLSVVQIRQPNFPELVSRILEEAGIAPSYLELELTESVAADDPLGAMAVMNKLHEYGVRLSIDDFGTGYSSLSYLKRFKVDKLKIDQSFVRGVIDDPDDQAIVTAIISLANSLGMQTIAEGVETRAQMEFLRDRGCDEIQGYWFSRPLPADQFEAFVQAHGNAGARGADVIAAAESVV